MTQINVMLAFYTLNCRFNCQIIKGEQLDAVEWFTH